MWYLRPRGKPGEKLETYWIGPSRVVERRSEHSYIVDIGSGSQQEAHRSQLKHHVEDVWSGQPIKMFRFQRAVREDDDDALPDEWELSGVEGHRMGPDGYPEFLVRWEGSEERTWEPLSHFFLHCSPLALEYCVKKGIKVPDMLEYLHKHPAEAAIKEVWEDPPEEWIWDDHMDRTEEDDKQHPGGRRRVRIQG